MQWLNQASTTAGRAADQIGYTGEKDGRLWICASWTGRKEGMLFLESHLKDSLSDGSNVLSVNISARS